MSKPIPQHRPEGTFVDRIWQCEPKATGQHVRSAVSFPSEGLATGSNIRYHMHGRKCGPRVQARSISTTLLLEEVSKPGRRQRFDQDQAIDFC